MIELDVLIGGGCIINARMKIFNAWMKFINAWRKNHLIFWRVVTKLLSSLMIGFSHTSLFVLLKIKMRSLFEKRRSLFSLFSQLLSLISCSLFLCLALKTTTCCIGGYYVCTLFPPLRMIDEACLDFIILKKRIL
jgi:hypothetical protein